MKTYKIIRDIAIIIIALVVLNNQYQILDNQALIAKSMVELAEASVKSVEVLSTVDSVKDTTFVLDTIAVPKYKTITRIIKKTVLDTVTITKVVDSINYFTVIDTIKISAEQPIKSDSTAIELEVKDYLGDNTFIHNNETYKLVNDRLYVYKDNEWVKPNKLKSNRGKFTPHRIKNKEYLSQIRGMIDAQHIKLAYEWRQDVKP